MPILNIHLGEGLHTAGQHEELLVEASKLYADILESPIERVRAFVTLHPPSRWVTGGVPASVEPRSAPYFSALYLEGRSVEQRQRLLAGLTDLIVKILGVDRKLVRGWAQAVDPDDWAIGGTPASALRAAEIAARASGAEI